MAILIKLTELMSGFWSLDKLYTAPLRSGVMILFLSQDLWSEISLASDDHKLLFILFKKGEEREHGTTRRLGKSCKHLRWRDNEPTSFCLYRPKLFLIMKVNYCFRVKLIPSSSNACFFFIIYLHFKEPVVIFAWFQIEVMWSPNYILHS